MQEQRGLFARAVRAQGRSGATWPLRGASPRWRRRSEQHRHPLPCHPEDLRDLASGQALCLQLSCLRPTRPRAGVGHLVEQFRQPGDDQRSRLRGDHVAQWLAVADGVSHRTGAVGESLQLVGC